MNATREDGRGERGLWYKHLRVIEERLHLVSFIFLSKYDSKQMTTKMDHRLCQAPGTEKGARPGPCSEVV